MGLTGLASPPARPIETPNIIGTSPPPPTEPNPTQPNQTPPNSAQHHTTQPIGTPFTVELPRESQPHDRRVGHEPRAPVRALLAGFSEEGGRQGRRQGRRYVPLYVLAKVILPPWRRGEGGGPISAGVRFLFIPFSGFMHPLFG